MSTLALPGPDFHIDHPGQPPCPKNPESLRVTMDTVVDYHVSIDDGDMITLSDREDYYEADSNQRWTCIDCGAEEVWPNADVQGFENLEYE